MWRGSFPACRRFSIRSRVAGDFDFFILSDSTDPANWIAEEVAWQRLRASLEPDARDLLSPPPPQHRAQERQHPGFLRELGRALRLYGGAGRRQSDERRDPGRPGPADGRQSPRGPDPGAGRTWWDATRCSPASSNSPRAPMVPPYTAGLAWLQGRDGNYWGHNAIIRVRAFQQHGGLPQASRQAAFRRRDHEP